MIRARTIAGFCSAYGVGKTTAYSEIKSGRLRAVKIGRRTLIPEDSAELWLQRATEVEYQRGYQRFNIDHRRTIANPGGMRGSRGR